MAEKKPTSAFVLGSSLPIVRSISSQLLINEGYVKEGTVILPNSQTMETTYRKGENYVTYNGATWRLNGKERVEFMEDLQK